MKDAASFLPLLGFVSARLVVGDATGSAIRAARISSSCIDVAAN